jgi:hypothetical protein
MVAFELYHVLVSCIFFVELVSVVRFDEVVLQASREKCWDEAFVNMVDRGE